MFQAPLTYTQHRWRWSVRHLNPTHKNQHYKKYLQIKHRVNTHTHTHTTIETKLLKKTYPHYRRKKHRTMWNDKLTSRHRNTCCPPRNSSSCGSGLLHKWVQATSDPGSFLSLELLLRTPGTKEKASLNPWHPEVLCLLLNLRAEGRRTPFKSLERIHKKSLSSLLRDEFWRWIVSKFFWNLGRSLHRGWGYWVATATSVDSPDLRDSLGFSLSAHSPNWEVGIA